VAGTYACSSGGDFGHAGVSGVGADAHVGLERGGDVSDSGWEPQGGEERRSDVRISLAWRALAW